MYRQNTIAKHVMDNGIVVIVREGLLLIIWRAFHFNPPQPEAKHWLLVTHNKAVKSVTPLRCHSAYKRELVVV